MTLKSALKSIIEGVIKHSKEYSVPQVKKKEMDAFNRDDLESSNSIESHIRFEEEKKQNKLEAMVVKEHNVFLEEEHDQLNDLNHTPSANYGNNLALHGDTDLSGAYHSNNHHHDNHNNHYHSSQKNMYQ